MNLNLALTLAISLTQTSGWPGRGSVNLLLKDLFLSEFRKALGYVRRRWFLWRPRVCIYEKTLKRAQQLSVSVAEGAMPILRQIDTMAMWKVGFFKEDGDQPQQRLSILHLLGSRYLQEPTVLVNSYRILTDCYAKAHTPYGKRIKELQYHLRVTSQTEV